MALENQRDGRLARIDKCMDVKLNYLEILTILLGKCRNNSFQGLSGYL